MNITELMTFITCGLITGLTGWLFYHSVDRRAHLNGQILVSDEMFSTRLSALEDRLKGEIIAVKVKLEDLEQFTHHIDRRLEKIIRD
jgi:hypothetical protein